MKHQLATMLLTALLCAIAAPGKAEGATHSVYNRTIDGGTVKIYGAVPTSDPAPAEITEAEEGSTVYLVAEPAAFHTTDGLELRVVMTAKSSVAESRTRALGYAVEITPTLNEAGGYYTFTMPDGGWDAAIYATFPKRVQTVAYLDPTKPAGQQECEVEAYILDEPVEELVGSEEGTWYVCTGDVTYETSVTFSGNVHLILADGKTMTVTGPDDDDAIHGETGSSLTIYGQSLGTGALVASGDNFGIFTNGSFTLNGGRITATGFKGIAADGEITINGGVLNATGSYSGVDCTGVFTFNGGKVVAIGPSFHGIYTSTGDIVLGWTNPDDYIYASSYARGTGTVSTAAGKRFVAYSVDDITAQSPVETAREIIPAGSITELTVSPARMLRPIDGYLVAMPTGVNIVGDGSFTITTGEGDETVVTRYGIYKASTEEAPVNVTIAPDVTYITKISGLPEGTAFQAVNGQDLQRTFAMPAQDVTLTPTAVMPAKGNNDGLVFNGNAQTPDIYDGETKMIYQTDYTTVVEIGGEPFSGAVDVGDYTVTITGLGQYVGTSNEISFSIVKKTLASDAVSVSVAGGLSYTGSALTPEVTVSYTEGETTKTLMPTDFTVSYQKQTGTNPDTYEDVTEVEGVGTYVAIVNAATDGNYTFEDGDVTSEPFEVGKPVLTVTANNISVTYGTSSPNYTANYAGFVDNDDASSLGGTLSFACSYTSTSSAGTTFDITPGGLTSDKYDISYTAGTLTVTNANMTGVSASGWSGQYDGNDHGITVSAPSGADIRYRTAPSGTYDLTASPTFSSVGNHTVYYQVTKSNYDAVTGSASIVISQAVIAYDGGTITLDENGYTVSLNESIGSATPLPVSGTMSALDYSRTLTAPGSSPGDVTIGGDGANLYTVCLPYSPDTGTGVTYYTLNKVEGTTLSFEEISGSPAAFTPYLVAVKGNSNFTEDCSDVSFETSTAIISTTANGYTFTGTLTGLTNNQALGKYILQTGNKWGKVTALESSARIPPFRAYIEGPANGARMLTGHFDGDATSIQYIRTTDADGTEQWYDLQGRPIAKPATKGIYIHNGRKEVLK